MKIKFCSLKNSCYANSCYEKSCQPRNNCTQETDVISWDGGIVVDRKRYSIYLQKIVGDMLNPDEDMRPNAEQILRNTKNLIDILTDAQSKARAKPQAFQIHRISRVIRD